MPSNWRNGPKNRESFYSPDERELDRAIALDDQPLRDAEWEHWWKRLMKRQTERSEK